MSIFQRLKKLVRRETPKAPPTANVRIVTDSTADLPPSVAEELNITVVPLYVLFGEESFRDGIDLRSAEFFQRLSKTKTLPRTSQPSVGDFLNVYSHLAESADRILSIHLSAKFSGTVETARQAASALADQARVEVIDSGTVSMAMGLGVIAAARAAQRGADLETCAKAARSVFLRERVAIALDTLEYLRRGGRIGRAQALLGGILHVKPILTISNGEAHPLARVRTRRKALDEVLSLCLDAGGVVEAAVMHTASPADAADVANAVRARFPDAAIYTGEMGPVIGVHGGPGVVGLVVVAQDEHPDAAESG